MEEETWQSTTKAGSMVAQEGEQGSEMVAMAVGGMGMIIKGGW